jgi:fluoride exporter
MPVARIRRTPGGTPECRGQTMNILGVLAVFCGAGLGALLRWVLGLRLNPVFPTLPLGTLAANLIGGLLVGFAVAWLGRHPGLPPEVRLFVITGFLGGLTTFSTFSAEVVNLLGRGEYGWGLASAGAHLTGSLILTAIGMVLANLLSTLLERGST